MSRITLQYTIRDIPEFIRNKAINWVDDHRRLTFAQYLDVYYGIEYTVKGNCASISGEEHVLFEFMVTS